MAFDYKIVEHIATLSDSGMTTKELNRISYNGAAPKYDLRTWQKEGDSVRMLKGITLNAEEFDALREAVQSMKQ